MSKYGYNENEHLKIEAEAIDKDGFHKKVEIEDGSESSSGEAFEADKIYIEKLVYRDNSERLLSMIIFSPKNYPSAFKDYMNGDDVEQGTRNYIYFGDSIIDDDRFELIINNGEVDIQNYEDLGLQYSFGLIFSYFINGYSTLEAYYGILPSWNNIENEKAHVVLTYYTDNGTNMGVIQFHQK